MLDAIMTFFRGHLAGPDTPTADPDDPTRLRQAACALLVELAWADGGFSDTERSQLTRSLETRMGLDPDTASELIALAEAERHTAHDYYQFTSLVAQHFSAREKHLLLEVMWELILADGTISRAEDHLIRRVAPLLGLETRSVADAKARVLQRTPSPPGE